MSWLYLVTLIEVIKKKNGGLRLPDDMDSQTIHGLTTEVMEKLTRVRPVSLGQASRISGVTPAALMALQVNLKRSGTKALTP